MSIDADLVRFFVAGLPQHTSIEYQALLKSPLFHLWQLKQSVHRSKKLALDTIARDLSTHGVELNNDDNVTLESLQLGTDQVSLVVFDDQLMTQVLLDSEGADIPRLVKLFQTSLDLAKKAMSPSDGAKVTNFGSEQEKGPVLNGRPFYNRGPPIAIFHPVSARFLQLIRRDLRELEAHNCIPQTFVNSVHKFLLVSSKVYKKEHDRRHALEPILEELLAMDDAVANADRSCSDGQQSFRAQGQRLVSLLWELKNEIGAGGCCPVVQSSLSYRKYAVNPKRLPLLSISGIPVFTLAIAGPWLSVGGAFFGAEPMAQQLTDMVYIGFDPLHDDCLLQVANILFALKTCCRDLIHYYTTLEPNGHSSSFPRSACFPSQTSYPCGGNSVEFVYEDILVNRSASLKLPAKAVFKAKTTSLSDQRSIVVKFVRRYGGQVHRVLHAVNLAPELLYDGTDDPNAVDFGGLRMVVMAWVSGTTFGEHRGPKDRLQDLLNEALKTLGRDGWVHGDLRPPNVLVSSTENLQIIDFDWSGRNGEARYPLTLNDTLDWANGVRRGGVITHAHDQEMVKKLISN
ncbi:hypothetical protein PTI98_008983 [Pleurotus ostreatus]|uniref:Uncharacterized protein n=1 Tax=Pleurotus cornucopiae TaxID=5321 RepID=A0ACB7IUV9_PLECO|nr:hypothetical protein CCMSSC00406_0009216 [Pleurotus cornucopiae]KAJ8694050.1 hypothetical protein PTI98_008983 [Pleurotus ostreatus]